MEYPVSPLLKEYEMTLKDKLDQELSAARQAVVDLEAKAAALPQELWAFDEELWVKVKSFLGVA